MSVVLLLRDTILPCEAYEHNLNPSNILLCCPNKNGFPTKSCHCAIYFVLNKTAGICAKSTLFLRITFRVLGLACV